MINKKYYKMHYTISPIFIDMDISNDAIKCGLQSFNFSLLNKYRLVIDKTSLIELGNLLYNQIVNLEIEIEEIENNGWYLVDLTNKKIVYSNGA